MKTKTAMITIAGRPNVGKSTLANALVGEKIAIVSHKPQTTRNRICAIVDRGDTQLVFIDTPGFHRPRTKLGDYMVNVVNQSVADVDAVILLVEPIANVGPQEQELIEKIREANVPAILVINKIDTVEKENAAAGHRGLSRTLWTLWTSSPSAPSGTTGWTALMQVCEGFAQQGPFMFPEGISTDMPEKQVMAEIIREKLLWNLEKEIPHGTAVEITKFSERDDGIIDLDATIYCEKASHKGIIIGKNGADAQKDQLRCPQGLRALHGHEGLSADLGPRQGKLARQRLHDLQLRLSQRLKLPA